MLIGPTKIWFLQCIFQVQKKSHVYIFRLFSKPYGQCTKRAYFLLSKVPELFHVRSTVSLSNGHNDVSVRRPYGFLLYIQLCCCLLFIVHEYVGIQPNTLFAFVTHFIFFTHIARQAIVAPAYDYITASNQSVKLPCKHYCINFYLSGYT